MAGTLHQRKPTFLWQAALILLPVAVLAVMGWYSLRQDKVLADHDGREGAQAIADELLPRIWDKITSRPSGNLTESDQALLEVDRSGQLIFPPPSPLVPTPEPFDVSQLDVEQTRLWHLFEKGEASAEDTNT